MSAVAAPPVERKIDREFIEELVRICGEDGVLTDRSETLLYECDAFVIQKQHPDIVVLPTSTQQVARVVRLCSERGVPFLGRGAGTGLAGGALPIHGGVIVALTRMKQILDVDLRNRRIRAQAGVVNLTLSRAVAGDGYQYAPDPSSQMACTIGGNVANNSGGPHTLKYGVTVNHVLGVTLVLPSGEVVEIGGAEEDHPGYDLAGIVVGSEGTFGIVTEVTARLVRLPQTVRTMLAVFETVEDATNTVSGIIAAGIVPAALEMMDAVIIQAVEAAFQFGFPLDAGACLIIELDGLEAGIDAQAEAVREICRTHRAREVRLARDAAERDSLWKARKRAFGAAGRLAPSNVTQDGVIPRTKLPQVLREIGEIIDRHGLKVANVFHAGDGNLHPLILFDERDPAQMRAVVEASEEIMRMCVAYGGSITGEHGIGIEKSGYVTCQFSEVDLDVMLRLKGVFDPKGLCNPSKMFPSGHGCMEVTMKKRRSVAL
ncbi:MAG: FAD-binding oxidoreductase [Armatimonadota bacterium]